MFSALSERLSAALKQLTGRGVLTEDDVREGLREIRRVLLEADVGFEVARDFTERVRQKAVGVLALKVVSPGQQLVKIVHDELTALLGERRAGLEFASLPPTVILLVGLQGSGKTTTAVKLGARLKREQKAPWLVAADPYRPAAEEQLRQLAAKAELPVYGLADYTVPDVVALVRAGIAAAVHARARTVVVDTAGRMQLDAEMMQELVRLKEAFRPHEVLLVADGMTGQDAVRIARGFHEAVGLTGVILTKLDGDARGGAALSMYGVTRTPIKYIGTGERLDALEPFDPARMAGRILQMGDVVGLVERAQQTVDQAEAQRLASRATSKRGMDLADFLSALKQVRAMGPLESLVGLLPGVNAKLMKQAKVDPRRIKHVEAIVLSMTSEERQRPDLLNGSRRARIARGSGRPVQEVNALLKQFEQMRKMMRGFGGFARGKG
ncbi:MAG: signal recognition particle protein [Gemmatimonadetes bacterium]|nr:signal recognition particle protein [Gemmatimonadota bacterium]